MANLGSLYYQIGADTKGLRSAENEVKSSANRMSNSFLEVGRSAAAMFGGVSLAYLANEIKNTGLEVNRLEQAFKNITGSTSAASTALSFVSSLADKTGNDFLTLAGSFKEISAAAKGTALEGEGVRKVFESVIKYGTSLSLSNEQMGGSLYALSQMISKGVVSMEELRQQLGERLPGAFQIAARSMGMTTSEFSKMVSEGKLLSEDFLPKFSEELGKASGEAENALGPINRLKNALVDLSSELWKRGGKSVTQTIADQITYELKRMKQEMTNWDQYVKAIDNIVGVLQGRLDAQTGRPIASRKIVGLSAGGVAVQNQFAEMQGLIDAAMEKGEGSPFQWRDTWSKSKTEISAAQNYWAKYREGAAKSVKEVEKMIEAMQKKELSGLEQMLSAAESLRKQYENRVVEYTRDIQKNKIEGSDMVRELKRRSMTDEQLQKDVEKEAWEKLSSAYSAKYKGDLQAAIQLAEQSRQIASQMDNTTKAIRGVQSATSFLDSVYKQQKQAAVTGFDEQTKKIAALGEEIKTKAAEPMKELVGHIAAANIALGEAGEKSFEIKGLSENIQKLSLLQTKLQEIETQLQSYKEMNINVTMTHSPKTDFTTGYNQILQMLNSLPTGSNYNMNMMTGLTGFEGNRILGVGAVSPGNQQYYELIQSRDEIVNSLMAMGMDLENASNIFTEFVKTAGERLSSYGQLRNIMWDAGTYYGGISTAYNTGALQYQMSQSALSLQDAVVSALSGSSTSDASSSVYGDGGYSVEFDIGQITVNLNGGSTGVDNARITAEEIDSQLAEIVRSNRSKLKAALKATWN